MTQFQSEILQRMDRLEHSFQETKQEKKTPARRPLVDINHSHPLQCVSSANSDLNMAFQDVLGNQKFSNGVQMGMALVKTMFTEQELASCTLTGRTVNGQARHALDSSKLKLIEDLIQNKYNLIEAEFSSTRSSFCQALLE